MTWFARISYHILLTDEKKNMFRRVFVFYTPIDLESFPQVVWLQLNGLTAAAFFCRLSLRFGLVYSKTIYSVYMLDIIFQSISVIVNL